MKHILAEVIRGATVESVHCGSVVVAGNSGRILYSFGDPNFFTFLRSSAKPFQMLPLLESGAIGEFGFTQRELAIIAGSHNGEPSHVRVVQSILKKIGLSQKFLQCGIHPPLYYTVRGILPRKSEKFSALQHNCSGKHAGMLALCVYKNWNPGNYLHPRHPLQKEIQKSVAEVCSFPAGKIKIGVDGCSAPNFALPLRNMALGFARLASAGENGNPLGIVLTAMQSYPEMVSGRGRLDYALSQAAQGKIVAKAGAEALECFGVVGPGMGMAVRIYDGNNRAVGCVVVETLKQLGFLKDKDMKKLEKIARPEIKNNAGKPVGFIRPAFKLKRGK